MGEQPSCDDKYDMNITRQCYIFDGKFVKIKAPTSGSIQTEFLKPKIYTDKTTLPSDKVLTFVIDTSGNFVATPVDNKFEIGTGHLVLDCEARRLGKLTGDVVFAGEIKGKQFNLLSGSFMAEKMEDGEAPFIEPASAAMPGFTYSPVTGKTFINKEAPELQVSREHLDKYIDAGLQVRLYAKRGDCNRWVEPPDDNQKYVMYQKAGRRRKTRRRIQRKRKITKRYILQL